MPKKFALFVDDEEKILRGLQRILHPLKKDWQLLFATSAAEAMTLMANHQVAVLVSDMRMPGMNGLELLRHAQRHHPATVRVMLTGQPDRDMYCEVLSVSHYFLWKPANSEDLLALFASIRDLDAHLHDPQMLALVGSLSSLPSLPSLYVRLTNLLGDNTADPLQVASLVREDIAMAAQIMKLVNSAYFGLSRRLETLEESVAYLGLDMLRQLVLVHHLFAGCSESPPCRELLEQLWRHSLQTASLAKQIAIANGLASCLQDSAYLAGLLHDIGKLVLIRHLPEAYATILQTATASGDQLASEQQVLGTDHAIIGGYLASLWGLPHHITQVLTFHHHHPAASGREKLMPVAEAVWHANRISQGDSSQSSQYQRLIEIWREQINS